MNVLAADRGEGISGRRSLLAAHVYREICQRRHRIAPPHDRSSPVWFLPLLAARFGRRGQRRGTWTSSAPLPVGQVLGRSVGEHATGFAVCVIGAGRGGCPPSVVPHRRLPRPRKAAVRGRGAVVINSYPALCRRSAGCS